MALKIAEKNASHDRRAEDLANAVVTLKTKPEFVREINRLWQEAHDKFLAIGRYLIMAKQELPHGEYMAMIDRELPFKPNTGRMIVTATQAIDGGLLPASRVPANYSTVYALTTLTEEERVLAEQRGLIRPDVRRIEVLNFKRDLAASRISESDRLRDEQRRLMAEQQRIMARLKEIQDRIGGAVVIDAEPVED